jgi:hypothetical protein
MFLPPGEVGQLGVLNYFPGKTDFGGLARVFGGFV